MKASVALCVLALGALLLPGCSKADREDKGSHGRPATTEGDQGPESDTPPSLPRPRSQIWRFDVAANRLEENQVLNVQWYTAPYQDEYQVLAIYYHGYGVSWRSVPHAMGGPDASARPAPPATPFRARSEQMAAIRSRLAALSLPAPSTPTPSDGQRHTAITFRRGNATLRRDFVGPLPEEADALVNTVIAEKDHWVGRVKEGITRARALAEVRWGKRDEAKREGRPYVSRVSPIEASYLAGCPEDHLVFKVAVFNPKSAAAGPTEHFYSLVLGDTGPAYIGNSDAAVAALLSSWQPEVENAEGAIAVAQVFAELRGRNLLRGPFNPRSAYPEDWDAKVDGSETQGWRIEAVLRLGRECVRYEFAVTPDGRFSARRGKVLRASGFR